MPSTSRLPRPVCLDTPDDPEVARLLRLCDPGPAIDGPLTFVPPESADGAAWMNAWEVWRTELFAMVLAPALAAAAVHAASGRAREMRVLDETLTSQLDAAVSTRSMAAGRRLLRRLGTSRGDRWLAKFRAWDGEGAIAAHFPIIYAGQNAFFHLPLRLLLPSYAYWEWVAAMSACPPQGQPPRFWMELPELQRLADRTLAPTLFQAADESPGAIQL